MPKLECEVCGKLVSPHSTCWCCGSIFCKKHRRPEEHGCRKLPQARLEIYDGEEMFACLICKRKNVVPEMFHPPWEIPRHLSEIHKIRREQQIIPEWNAGFEKEYLENINEPIEIEREPTILVDSTSSDEYEKEKDRIKKELRAKRDSR